VSKAQLVITAVVLEGRSNSEVARDYDVGHCGKLGTLHAAAATRWPACSLRRANLQAAARRRCAG
jgi:hypothetical protein